MMTALNAEPATDWPASIPHPAAPARPFAADDPSARALLCRAQGAFQKWPEGFHGFRASVRCQTSDGTVIGRVALAPPDRVEVECPDHRLRTWLDDMLRTFAAQRTP